jgi:hypothetical protein
LRADAVRKVGGFDLALGPRPEVAFGRDEEEELQDRLQADGFEIWWEPAASVHHHLPAKRLEPAHFEAFMRSQGSRYAEAGGDTVVGAGYRLARTGMRYGLAALLRDADHRTEARISLAYRASVFRGALRR